MVLKIFNKKTVPDELPDLASDEIEEKENVAKKIAEKPASDQKKEAQKPIEEKPVEKKIEEIKPATEIKKTEEVKSIAETKSEEKPTNETKKTEEVKIPVKEVKEEEKNEISEKKQDFNENKSETKTISKILENEQKGEKILVLDETDSPKIIYIDREGNQKKGIIQKNNKSFFNEIETDLSKEIKDLNELEEWYKKKILPRDIVTDMRDYWEKKANSTIMKILGKNFQEKVTEKTAKLQELERDWQKMYFQLVEKEEEIRDHERDLKKMLSEFVEECKKRETEKLNSGSDNVISFMDNS